jgi:DNA-binding transcriptional LysR family regulator
MLNPVDLSRTDLNLLVLFEVVLEERHVGRAAARLNLTPSAVSHGLGRLRRLLNDPLFLRTPRGVVPTARAAELAAPVADALGRVRGVISTAVPFDPATSGRRFTIGAPDSVSAVLFPVLLAKLGDRAPGVGVSLRQLLPVLGEVSPEHAWRIAFADLEARAVDIAIVPSDHIPARFHASCLYEEDFVVAMRAGHPLAGDLTLERYCAAQHLMVSLDGDPHGFIDDVLAREGRVRHVALTVPNFMLALAVLAETDLIAALPRRFVAIHAARFGVLGLDAPLRLTRFRLNAVAPRAAMLDLGLAWLFSVLEEPQQREPGRTVRPHGSAPRPGPG